MRVIFGVLGLSLGMGCDDGGEVERTVDAAVVTVSAKAYADGGFTRVNTAAFESAHMGARVNVWVNNAALAAYRGVDPDDDGADPDFPEGTLIVKEQLGEGDAVAALTVMYKGPTGSGAASDDWHWQMIGADGVAVNTGEVGFCIDCHRPRRDSDWVFGVESDNRVP